MTKQGSHKPGGTVTKGERRIGQVGGTMVVRENGMSTRRQAGRYQKRVVAEQRGGTILYPHRWPSLGTRRCSFGILLQVAHRGDKSEGNNSYSRLSRLCTTRLLLGARFSISARYCQPVLTQHWNTLE